MEMAEFWARIAAGCGCTCCRGPIVPQSEPTTHHHAGPGAAGITLGTGLGVLGDGLVGLDSVGRGTAEHMGAKWKRPPILLTKAQPSCEGRACLGCMRPTQLGSLMGSGWALVFRNAPGLTQAIWGQDPVKSGTVQRRERRSGPCRHLDPQPVTSLREGEPRRLKHTQSRPWLIIRHSCTVAPTVAPTKKPSTTFGTRSDVCVQMTKPFRTTCPPRVRHTSGGRMPAEIRTGGVPAASAPARASNILTAQGRCRNFGHCRSLWIT